MYSYLRDTLRQPMRRFLALLLWAALAIGLGACSGKDDEEEDKRSQAERAGIGNLRHVQGSTVFIANLGFSLRNYDDLAGIAYSIAPRPGTHSRPLAVSIDKSWLERRGAYRAAEGRLELPVFGLYAAHANTVSLTARFRDGSQHAFRASVQTGLHTGPSAIYATPDILVARSPDRVPGFDFVMIKNGLSAPVVIDTDGHMRWTGSGLDNSFSSLFGADGNFYVGSQASPVLYRMDPGGLLGSVNMKSPTYANFHHELAPGKTGMLAQFDATVGGVRIIESVLAEIDAEGNVLKEWDMGRIFADYMRSKGDNPAGFVRDGIDWFHMNSAIYNRADNSLLVSSRENFVVKLDYDTGAIRWLFGDTGKHWYVNYPSLRDLALRLVAGKAPIGQHSLSVRPDGQLLLFNNGLGSLNQPASAPRGATRTFSTPSRYAIDEQAGTARETWTYERNRELYSDICSSVVEGAPGSHLVTYSVVNQRTGARLLGVDEQGKVTFDFAYPTYVCDTAFMAEPLAWNDLKLR